ncbi:MAG TPA: sigma factor [Chitinophagaceae bacterium]|jgi:DNA-directed RNA polymerase specialized sigma24 family protein|nr:sigma factor [Chitinophagaceae bacterium]
MVPTKLKDTAVYSCLYDKYAPALYGVILKLTPNDHVANGILEKSFLKIWDELHDYDVSKGRLFSLMLRTTLQVCKSELGPSKNILHYLFAKEEHSTLIYENMQ